MTIRALGVCASKKVQEFARIIFVDNLFNCTRKLEHHAPLSLAKRPSYDAVSPAVVSLNEVIIFIFFTFSVASKHSFFEDIELPIKPGLYDSW